ncbi:MAG TPA: hypothetical protein VMZ52_18190 [Bryobacteraceae bacterium]|nr:hypothetical protein [Bryobacteraceae bacterium]
MKSRVRVAALLLSGLSLYAQTPPSAPVRPEVLESHSYVRRFSMGATLSVLAFHLIPNRTTDSVVSSPPSDSIYTTTGATDLWHRVGYGVTAQAAITERFAINAGLFMRRAAYRKNSDIFEGTDNPTTLADERRHTIRNEDTRARFFDLPVTIRYYGKDRHQPGWRWFGEIGGAVRRASGIRTSTDTTIGTGTTSCCSTTPIMPTKRNARGAVAGLGLQFIDDFGIRIVPGVRYTRWVDQTFNASSTGTQRNQVEATISLTF